MSRIKQTFDKLSSQKKKALIPFITAGDPAPDMTVPLMHALVRGGADILELGVPFSDPMAEGPVIQRACERALTFGVGLRDVLGCGLRHQVFKAAFAQAFFVCNAVVHHAAAASGKETKRAEHLRNMKGGIP
jgi:tryptophan synthase alpha subunit